MEVKLLRKGSKFDIYAVSINGKIEAIEFIDTLDEPNLKQLIRIIERIKDHGPLRDPTKFKSLGDKICEIKTSSGPGFRVLCFNATMVNRPAIVLTHGFPKPKKNQLRREKAKAVDILNEYYRTHPIRIVK